MATAMHEEDDSLASLEERIRRTAELVTTLRAERELAIAERDAARDAAGTATAQLEKLREEIDDLRNERKQVRLRIEKLLRQMDQLSGL